MRAPDDVRLPCGCVIRCATINRVPTILIEACDADCWYVRWAAEEARASGKTVEYQREVVN